MPEFELITTVPKGFLPMPPQRVGAGTYEKTSSTKQTLSVFATVGGLATGGHAASFFAEQRTG